MMTLGRLSEMVAGRLSGDPQTVINNAASIMRAGEGDITFATNETYFDKFLQGDAIAAVVPQGLESTEKALITVEDVESAFTKIVSQFRKPFSRSRIGISPQATISSSAKIADDVDIYPGVFIGDGVEIECGSVIMPNVTILEQCKIGAHTQVFPLCVLYEGTVVGNRCILHGGVVLGAYGFGYKSSGEGHRLTAQLGNVVIENDVEIGANSTIDRGTYEPTLIGEGTKIDDQVMIGHNCQIGKHNLLCSQVGIAGSCTTGDFVVMAGQVGIGDHIHIGNQVTLVAKTGVMKDIEDGAVLGGAPAMPVRQYMQVEAVRAKLPELRKQLKQLTKAVAKLENEQTPEGITQRDAA